MAGVAGTGRTTKGRLTIKRRLFVEHYFLCGFNQTEAARRTGYRHPEVMGCRLMKVQAVREAIEARIAEVAMSANEVLYRLSQQARADMGVFFKEVRRWTEEPLPTQELTGEMRRMKDARGRETTEYEVRQIVLDLDKLRDPRYSHLVRKFIDSPRDGLSIELYDGQRALRDLGKHHRLFNDLTLNINVGELTDEQLARLAAGEDPAKVLRKQDPSATQGRG